jgi:hypothetical protein
MSVPRKKRRIRLIIILGKVNDDYAILLLSKAWPIYEKIENSQTLTTDEEAVAAAVDGYYLAHDPQDGEDFSACHAQQLDSETKAPLIDALETAVQDWE